MYIHYIGLYTVLDWITVTVGGRPDKAWVGCMHSVRFTPVECSGCTGVAHDHTQTSQKQTVINVNAMHNGVRTTRRST